MMFKMKIYMFSMILYKHETNKKNRIDRHNKDGDTYDNV